MSEQTPVFGVTGWKNSGKTTLVSRLVAEITARGYSVSTVKHAHHNFDIDQKGRDSYAHREAGAHEVALVSGRRWALMHELRGEEEPSLADVLAKLSPCDLVIVRRIRKLKRAEWALNPTSRLRQTIRILSRWPVTPV